MKKEVWQPEKEEHYEGWRNRGQARDSVGKDTWQRESFKRNDQSVGKPPQQRDSNHRPREKASEAVDGGSRSKHAPPEQAKTRIGTSMTQNLAQVEKKYKELLEEVLPTHLSSIIRYPILYTEVVNSAFVIINNYLDARIKKLILDLGNTLGVSDQKYILLHIVLTYPNYLNKLGKDDLTEMSYLLRECFNDISLKRRP